MYNVDKSDYEEIERTIKDNHLSFQKKEDTDKEILIQRLYDTFVYGNPRALWLDFKYVSCSIDCHMEDPYFHLLDVIDSNAILYFFIDHQNVDFIVYKARMADIHTFIGDCEALDEYYIVTLDFKELYSSTDHGDLLYIDVSKNERKKLTAN